MATEKTRAQLKAARDAVFVNGATAGSIQPEVDADLREDGEKSSVNILENRDLLNLQDHKSARSKPYEVGEGFFKDGALRRAVVQQSGTYNAAFSQQLTLASITSVVPAYTAGETVTTGTIRSYEGALARRIGATGSGGIDDAQDWTIFTPLMPYYGQIYVANQVYVTNMVVRVEISSEWKLLRKVKPSGGSPEFIYSTDLAAEITAGEWTEEITLPNLTPVVPTLNTLGATLTVNSDTFHNQSYILTTGTSEVSLGSGVSAGVKVYFYLKTGSIEFSGTVASVSNTHSTLYVECCALSIGDNSWLVTQTQA